MEILLKYVSKAFRILFAILLWVALIAGVIGGLVTMFSNFWYGLLIIIGTPILVVLIGGYIATFLRNSENLERMANKLDPKQ